MNDLTNTFLTRLSATDWFANVGRPEQSTCGESFISDWGQAIASCTSTVFEDVTQVAANQLTIYLDITYPTEYMLWNKKVKEIRPILSSLVPRKIEEAARKGYCPSNVPESVVRWGLINACMAIGYSELFKSVYFERLAEWYLRGHFPCGWGVESGEFECTNENCSLVIF
jgi:hypothetical protein